MDNILAKDKRKRVWSDEFTKILKRCMDARGHRLEVLHACMYVLNYVCKSKKQGMILLCFIHAQWNSCKK